MNTKTRDALRAALFEASFVLLGVLLALLANDWRQNRADRDESNRALGAILEELRSNRDAVAESMDYHGELLQLLHGEHDPAWRPSLSDFPKGFIFPARVTRTAWDSAAETGALAKTDFAVVMDLSGAYALQERYEAQSQSIGDVIYGEIFRHGIDSILDHPDHLASIVSTFVYREGELLRQIEDTIAVLEERLD